MKRTIPAIVLLSLLVVLCLIAYAREGQDAEYYGKKQPDVQPPAPSADWERLGQPKPGEWLFVFKERGQTFAEYKKQCRNRKNAKRNKIYLVPLGDIAKEQPELIELSAEYLAIFFDTEVVQLAALPLPDDAYNKDRRQYDAGKLLDDVMLPRVRKRKDALAMIGLANRDLYHGHLNFVFGVASLSNRVGVYSVHRFGEAAGNDDGKLELLRTVKLASHEMGHIFGMLHCTFYECVLNGSNSLAETDGRPAFLCPVCVKKLEWCLGFDRLERYKKMEKFFTKCELEKQAAFCRRRVEELEKFENPNTDTKDAQ